MNTFTPAFPFTENFQDACKARSNTQWRQLPRFTFMTSQKKSTGALFGNAAFLRTLCYRDGWLLLLCQPTPCSEITCSSLVYRPLGKFWDLQGWHMISLAYDASVISATTELFVGNLWIPSAVIRKDQHGIQCAFGIGKIYSSVTLASLCENEEMSYKTCPRVSGKLNTGHMFAARSPQIRSSPDILLNTFTGECFPVFIGFIRKRRTLFTS